MTLCTSNRRSEQGFTLVELAIVMVIIGILIAGILKGQELINSSKVSATVAQLKATDAAFNTFQDKYSVLPGSMLAPQTRLENCAAAPCNRAGDGDSFIENGSAGPATALAGDTEANSAFPQLAAADLVTGVDQALGTVPGGTAPTVRAGGVMWISYAPAAIANTTLPLGRHYATITGAIIDTAETSGILNPTQAAQIDRKLDDGIPGRGTVQAATTGTNCVDTGVYNEDAGGGLCTLYMRVLN